MGKKSGIDRKIVEAALTCGLYENEEALIRDLSIDRNEDDFNRIATEHSLQSQIKAKCYGALLEMRGVVNVSSMGLGMGKLAMVLVVNGPGRMGTAIGPRGKTAEFKIKMRRDDWIYFMGRGSNTPLNVLAYAMSSHLSYGRKRKIGVTPGRLKAATERVVRRCNDPNWLLIKEFPIDVRGVEDQIIRQFLVNTPYGIDSSNDEASAPNNE